MNKISLAAASITLGLTSLAQAGGGPLAPARITIGGPNTCGSDGFNDPGLLNDGLTAGAALFVFVLDPDAATLTLTVDNTSPVIPGVPNPVITDIYFNCPAEVTGMSLNSQTSTSGSAPLFGLTFDDDLDSAPNPNGAAGFGAFGVGLNLPGGTNGAIANPAADTYGPAGLSLAMGPCTFVFDLTGDLTGLDSAAFTSNFSVVPPGDKVTTGVAKFQSGGVAEASGFITSPAIECFLALSAAAGSDPLLSPGLDEHVFPSNLAATDRVYGMTITGPVTVPFDRLPNYVAPTGTSGIEVVASFHVEGYLWNPDGYPCFPEQVTGGYEVTVWSDGSSQAVSDGNQSGMTLSTQTIVRPDGRQFLRFPFTTTTTNSSELACAPATSHYQGGQVTLGTSDLCVTSATGLRLEATGGPAGEFGFFLVSAGASGALPVFNGVLCLDAPMARYNAQVAANQGLPTLNSVGQFDASGVLLNLSGTSTTGTGFDVPAELPYVPTGQLIQPGETWGFQLWYRDQVGNPPVPGSSANFSDALLVLFS